MYIILTNYFEQIKKNFNSFKLAVFNKENLILEYEYLIKGYKNLFIEM